MKYVAFTDGSYKESNGIKLYGSAAIFAPIGTTDWSIITDVGDDPKYLRHHNVAGEVFAVIHLCNQLLKMKDANGKPVQIDSLLINYDYSGIEMWPTNIWKKTNFPLSQEYKQYMQTVAMPQLHITFTHTKGHSGIVGNEIVDEIVHKLVSDELAKRIPSVK